jgi:hypothetical protein
MTDKQNDTLTRLLAAWRRHDDPRSSEAPIAELGDARFSLDEIRSTTWAAFR